MLMFRPTARAISEMPSGSASWRKHSMMAMARSTAWVPGRVSLLSPMLDIGVQCGTAGAPRPAPLSGGRGQALVAGRLHAGEEFVDLRIHRGGTADVVQQGPHVVQQFRVAEILGRHVHVAPQALAHHQAVVAVGIDEEVDAAYVLCRQPTRRRSATGR